MCRSTNDGWWSVHEFGAWCVPRRGCCHTYGQSLPELFSQ